MAELEDFELILCRLILLFRDLCVTEIVLYVRLWSTHHHHRILGLIATHEGLIVLKSRLLHIVHGLHSHGLLRLDIIDLRIYATQSLESLQCLDLAS